MTARRSILTVARRPRTLLALAVIIVGATIVAIESASHATTSRCERVVVPAYFLYSRSAAEWAAADASGPPLSTLILDISGIGAGNSPQPFFEGLVSKARSAGITILGYSSTVDGQRPVSAVEADVRNYRSWYGVTDIFLDRVTGFSQQLPYYRRLAGYVHATDKASVVWLNVGTYPQNPQYMSVGNVVQVFEGTYSQYRSIHVPGWASHDSPARFATTIYATSKAELASALALALSRRAGYVYVTNGSGSNPYSSLPSYWSSELSAINAECRNAAAAAAASAAGAPRRVEAGR